jgi:hypothetical protein
MRSLVEMERSLREADEKSRGDVEESAGGR